MSNIADYNDGGVSASYVGLLSQAETNPYNVLREYNVERALQLAGCSLKGSSVADAGCGDGRWCRWMRERGATCIGLEYSQAMVDSAVEAERGSPAPICYIHADMTDTSFNMGSTVDAVLVFMVLQMAETSEQLQAMCTFISKLLKPGAPLVAAVLNPDYDGTRDHQNKLMTEECRFCVESVPGHPEQTLFKMAGSSGVVNYKHSRASLTSCLEAAGMYDVQFHSVQLPEGLQSKALQVYIDNPHLLMMVARKCA